MYVYINTYVRVATSRHKTARRGTPFVSAKIA